MRVLVTGGAGYIGTTLVPMMLAEGWHVTVLDRFPQGIPFLAACCANPFFDAVRGDVRVPGIVADLIPAHDVVVNLAAIVGAPACDVDAYAATSINQTAVKNIAALVHSSQLLLQPTSDSGYGVGYAANVCTEDHLLNPTSLYGRTKVEAEKHVIGAGGISLRLASVFGASPRMRQDLLVNDFVWRAVHDKSAVLFEGHFRRSFVHVQDVARAFIHAIKNGERMRGNAFNCGASSQLMTKRELVDRIAAQVPGFEYHETFGKFDPDRRDYVISYDKLETSGWQSQHTVDQGIQELVKLYRMMNRGIFHNG